MKEKKEKKVKQNKETPVTPVEEIKEEPIEEVKETPIEEPVEEVKETSIEEPKEEIQNTSPAPVAVNEPVKPKKRHTGLIVAVVCIIIFLFLAAFAGGAFFVVNKVLKNQKPQTTVKTEQPVKASAYRLSGNGLEDFDLYFLQLENKKENVVYSPLSIKYALAMLNEGTDGNSHNQILSVIGDYKAKKYNNNEHMSFANAMFIRNTFQNNIKSDYKQKLKDSYGAEIIIDKFENASTMNSWVSNKTFNLINNLLDDSTVAEENFILINALAIDMNWINRIQAATAPLPEGMGQQFYHVDYYHEKYSDSIYYIEDDKYPSMTFNGVENTKSVQVGASFNRYDIIKDLGEENIRKTVTEKYKTYLDEGGADCGEVEEYVNGYMDQLGENYKQSAVSTDFSIYVDDNIKIFTKDLQTYDGTTLQYVGIMPRQASLDAYIKEVNAKSIDNLLKEVKEVKYENFKEGVVTQINGNIPLFKYDYQLDLMGDLQKLGIEDVFDINKADMTKMLSRAKQYIGDATHKATIEFSNDGIKAAAATAMGGMGAAGCPFDFEYEVPVEKIDITFDKPYLYIIRDKATGEVWFTGTVYEPLKNE